MQNVFLVILMIWANGLANIFIKLGANQLGGLNAAAPWQSILKIITNPWIILGMILLVTNFPIYSFVLQKMRLSLLYPLVTTGAFAVVVLVSAVFLREKLLWGQYLGLALLAVAIVLLANGR